jgi:hypothetical protein
MDTRTPLSIPVNEISLHQIHVTNNMPLIHFKKCVDNFEMVGYIVIKKTK